MDTGHEEFTKASRAATERLDELIAKDGKRTVDDFHRELGHIMWDKCGMARNAEGLTQAISDIQNLRKDYNRNVEY